jgi:hypothetical protein
MDRRTIPRRWYSDVLRKSKSRSHDQGSESQLNLANDGDGTILISVSFYSTCDPNHPSVRPFTDDGKYIQVTICVEETACVRDEEGGRWGGSTTLKSTTVD